jgi:hypothetical protein
VVPLEPRELQVKMAQLVLPVRQVKTAQRALLVSLAQQALSG